MAGANLYLDRLRQLDKNSVLLTPNQRLAKYLRELYQRIQIDEQKTCWHTPEILPVHVWLNRLWENYANNNLLDLPLVLSSTQEALLWQQMLSASNYKDYFLRLAETASLVKAARGLLAQWLIDLDHPLFDSAEDYTALKSWIMQFEQTLEQQNWVDSASLPERITKAVSDRCIALPRQIALAGFNELSPQLELLLTTAKIAGSSVETIPLTEPDSTQQRLALEQQDDEWYAMARWAKQLHEQNPAYKVGCVIPGLDKQRDRIVQIFNEVFCDPETYNISAGKNLNTYPVIDAGLRLLRLHTLRISAEELYVILDSPFVAGGESERMQRSAFDRIIRSKNISSFTLEQLADIKACPILAKRMQKLKALLEDSGRVATFQDWAYYFNQLLACLGWPGERILNSEEYQVVEQWLNLLQNMRSLDVTNPPVDIYQALHALNQMAASMPFQPKSPAANIQLLGILEAAGLCFDYLWVSGMDDSAWPTQASPNPFIPKALQRERKMPHSAAERELEYCSHMTTLFKASASHVIFSHISKRDETELLPSPLIRDIPAVTLEELQLGQHCRHNERIFLTSEQESLCNETGPAVGAEEKIYGGVSVLKNQALCPFKAFSESRLHARKLEECIPGFTAKDRGITIHAILDKFWQQVKSHQELIQIPQDKYQNLLTEIIHEVVTEEATTMDNKEYIELEKQRLYKLIDDWLRLEKSRDDFTVISSEEETSAHIGPLDLTVRIDRIDELADGSHLIIDYKTGTSCTPAQWFSDRPEEPQLPLYAYLSRNSVSAVAFAQVATGKHAFKGISRDNIGVKGITPVQSSKSTDAEDWNELTSRWSIALNNLGVNFHDGIATLDPKKPAATCKHCGLDTLCRIKEYSGYTNDDEESA